MRKAVAVLVLACGVVPAAQRLTFDVASVRRNPGAPIFMTPMLQPGGRVVATNVRTSDVIRAAYELDENQLVGGPDWIDDETYDIEARGPADMPAASARAMLRALLEDRFALRTHREQRELPMYRLLSADGTRGPQLRAAGTECAPPTLPGLAEGVPPPPPPPPGPRGTPLRTVGPGSGCPSIVFTGHFSGRSFTMDAFAQWLSQFIRRPVVNATGITGRFDIDLTYAPPDDLAAPPGAPPPQVSSAPSLSSAIDEQLGLRLESGRGPVDVLVIDGIARPSGN